MTDSNQSLRVFVSHASEDKTRFVLPFAERLRGAGIDAWVDKWEMLPGDSLPAKIFREGTENATAFIVVLSRISITKPWVVEELDAVVVKRINEGSRLIPIVLDGLSPAAVPTPIRHLLYESVPDPSYLDDVVDRVLRSIHGEADRPPLGQAPTYANTPTARIEGLDRIDSLVLRAVGDEALREHRTRFTTETFLASVTVEIDISPEQAIESLEVPDNFGQIEIHRTLGRGIPSMARFVLNPNGLETYCRAYVAEFPKVEETVVARLAGWPSEQGSLRDLIAASDANPLLVEHVLDRCAASELVRVSRVHGPSETHFHSISPRLRRLANTR